MKLEYLDDISAGGKYSGIITDELIRLYDFNNSEAKEFYNAISLEIVQNENELSLESLYFIESLNCKLTLKLSNYDQGIITYDKLHFICNLSKTRYLIMLRLLEPFCMDAVHGYQWLYDLDTNIDFLFSAGGTW
ncbi:MAG TPA: hypothetical protein PKO18_07085 [Chitinophagales bacterium]|nr:hypothetical protein [Chitinophagales bacterium]HNL84984.1 hypothetical protein [Chitinophagales bacterium]